MVDAARARKLADRIKVVVAETLEMRVKAGRVASALPVSASLENNVGPVPRAVSSVPSLDS